jgi:micrococcal nuclease
MEKNIACDPAYAALIDDLSASLSEGLVRAQKALEQYRLKTYLYIGKRITTYVESHTPVLALNQTLYERISTSVNEKTGLSLSTDTLRRIIQLTKSSRVFPEDPPLAFSHYLALERVHDPRLRARIERRAIAEDLTLPELKNIISLATDTRRKRKTAPKNGLLPLERGTPFTYRTFRSVDFSGQETYRIDCGFRIDVPLIGTVRNARLAARIHEARAIRVSKNGSSYSAHKCHGGLAQMYTYPARVLKVVDGDTLDVHIDVGFHIATAQRLRLRKIDAPELASATGKRAKTFIEQTLKDCPLIILRTHKTEIYGRWLADLFFLPGCSDPYRIAPEGTYLNQMLLDHGFALRY